MPRIYIGGLHVNVVEDTSGIFSGENVQIDWRHSEKVNEGFGQVSGDCNRVQGDLLVVGDQDLVDTFINNLKSNHE